LKSSLGTIRALSSGRTPDREASLGSSNALFLTSHGGSKPPLAATQDVAFINQNKEFVSRTSVRRSFRGAICQMGAAMRANNTPM
jgi:hypothetical protein